MFVAIDKKERIVFRILRLSFHILGVILSIVLLCIDDPGFETSLGWAMMVGSLILHAVLIIPIFTNKE